MDRKVIEIAAHRGGALLWPENSPTAFENTARLSVDQVEFDVHSSGDGKLVIIHDPTLDRTTNGSGPVSARSFTELSRLTLRGTESDRILMLDEVIDIFVSTSLKLRVELKTDADRRPYPGMAKNVVDTLKRRNVLGRSIVTSFHIDTVFEAATAAGTALASHVLLVSPLTEEEVGLHAVIADAKRRGIPALGLRSTSVDADKIARVRAAGFGVGAWAVNDAATIGAMLQLQLDVFTTDRPDLALQMRQAWFDSHC
jgi:glycerophosphoryl diester phosphodiesterase